MHNVLSGADSVSSACFSGSSACFKPVGRVLATSLALGLALLCCQPSRAAQDSQKSPESQKVRLVVLTDIGGDPDDEQSMVRLVLYANEFDIEGLIAASHP